MGPLLSGGELLLTTGLGLRGTSVSRPGPLRRGDGRRRAGRAGPRARPHLLRGARGHPPRGRTTSAGRRRAARRGALRGHGGGLPPAGHGPRDQRAPPRGADLAGADRRPARPWRAVRARPADRRPRRRDRVSGRPRRARSSRPRTRPARSPSRPARTVARSRSVGPRGARSIVEARRGQLRAAVLDRAPQVVALELLRASPTGDRFAVASALLFDVVHDRLPSADELRARCELAGFPSERGRPLVAVCVAGDRRVPRALLSSTAQRVVRGDLRRLPRRRGRRGGADHRAGAPGRRVRPARAAGPAVRQPLRLRRAGHRSLDRRRRGGVPGRGGRRARPLDRPVARRGRDRPAPRHAPRRHARPGPGDVPAARPPAERAGAVGVPPGAAGRPAGPRCRARHRAAAHPRHVPAARPGEDADRAGSRRAPADPLQPARPHRGTARRRTADRLRAPHRARASRCTPGGYGRGSIRDSGSRPTTRELSPARRSGHAPAHDRRCGSSLSAVCPGDLRRLGRPHRPQAAARTRAAGRLRGAPPGGRAGRRRPHADDRRGVRGPLPAQRGR